MAQISVIVGVYKMPQFLPRCIEGILGQTFRDLELILVDDGSPDNCGEICDEYARKDSRVHVIHQKNAGICAARNAGLDWVFANSSSRWIFFHDNDDWIHPQTLERLREAALEKNAHIAVCGYQETTGDDPVIQPEQLVPVSRTPKDFYMQNFVNATVCWGKLYRRACFDGRRYPPGKYIEDEFLTYRLLFSGPVLAVIPAPLYAYFVNPAGISKKTWVPKRLDAWEAYDQQIAFFQEMGDMELVHFRYRGYLEGTAEYLKAVRQADNRRELAKYDRQIVKKLRRLIRTMWKLGYISFWSDYDILYQASPLGTRLYRLYLEWKAKRGGSDECQPSA